MRRWFIALFTAHFLLSVLGATLGHGLNPTVHAVPLAAAAGPGSEVSAPSDNHPGPLGGDHVLGDEFPEPTDGAQRLAFAWLPFGLPPTVSALQVFALPTPYMAARDRPPQRA